MVPPFPVSRSLAYSLLSSRILLTLVICLAAMSQLRLKSQPMCEILLAASLILSSMFSLFLRRALVELRIPTLVFPLFLSPPHADAVMR
jgi:hypothetical protein